VRHWGGQVEQEVSNLSGLFVNNAEWEPKTIGDVCKTFSGGTPSTTRKEFYGGDIPFIRSAEIGAEKTELFLTDEGLSSSAAKLVRMGDVLVALYGANSGDVALARIDGAINQAILCLRSTHSNAFIFNYLSLLKSWIITTYLQGGQGNLSGEIVKSIQLLFPHPKEQQKIADCLSFLDALIAAQADKLDALKTHKKGLMQQLFPREGETVPRLRFPEFREVMEWEEKPFDRVVVKSFYGTSSSTSENGKYPVLRMGNMVDGGLDFSKLVYIDLDDESFGKLRLIRGDILLNRTNSLDLVGKISMFDRNIECITASYIVAYRLDRKQIVPGFCNFLLNTLRYRAKIKALARPSVSQANINPTTFRNELVISIPNIAEQQRISDCLSSLDALIAAQADKLDVLKTHKKGLMQQLFPSPEAVGA